MVVRAIGEIFAGAGLVGTLWADDMILRGKFVKLYREYYAGEHRLKMTSEMRTMMQIDDAQFDRYNANYCEMVVDKLADRLLVQSVTGDADEASTWAGDVLKDNRGDGLQIDVHEAVLCDGETFVMCEYDDDLAQSVIAHEPVWDGTVGIMPVYDRKKLIAAAKVFMVGDEKYATLYYPGETVRYKIDGEGLVLIEREDTVRNGQEPGLPLVAFQNRGRHSVLVNVVPLQDSLNRALASMVMTGEMSAFTVMFARGWKPPAKVAPGMIYHQMVTGDDGNPYVSTDPAKAGAVASLNASYDLKRIEAGNLGEYINQGDWLIERISDVTSVPVPSSVGGSSTSSGEALKQRESGLVAKAQRLQIVLGNAWEDVIALVHRQQELFASSMPPAVLRWSARWMPAEVRSDAELRETAKLMWEWGFEHEALRVLSQTSAVNYSESDIKRLMAEKAEGVAVAMGFAAQAIPQFSDGLAV